MKCVVDDNSLMLFLPMIEDHNPANKLWFLLM